tara:strand:- start:21401 stop:22363 length:963 start_codon:yes stop_codon:yes gene_type:complete
MRVKFNKFERVAGLFLLTAFISAITVTSFVAVKKGWFTSKVKFYAILDSADGLFEGTQVQMAGLRVGQVTNVDLNEANKIRVELEVFEKFHERIRTDSQIMIVRPFVIGEKVVDILVGTQSLAKVEAGTELDVKSNTDIMDVLSGRRLGPFLENTEALFENFKILADAFADSSRTRSLVRVFDRIEPLIQSMDKASKNFTSLSNTMQKDQRFEIMIGGFTDLSMQMAEVLPEIQREVPDMGKQIGSLVNNMAVLAEEFKKLTPAVAAIAPDLPRVSLRAIEALDEAVVTMKAMQKSFFLRGGVEDVREEEATSRMPAGDK